MKKRGGGQTAHVSSSFLPALLTFCVPFSFASSSLSESLEQATVTVKPLLSDASLLIAESSLA